MRASTFLLPASLLTFTTTSALQLPNFEPFLAALQPYIPEHLQSNDTAEHDFLKEKRQYSNTCPEDFNSCANLGAPSLCCMTDSICSADQAGHVACCPSGAACTGTIGGVITGGTIGSNGAVVGGAGAATATSNNGMLAGSAATTTSFQYPSSTSSNNGLVAATTQATLATGDGASGNGFIVAGSSTVATPGAGIRRAEVVSAFTVLFLWTYANMLLSLQ